MKRLSLFYRRTLSAAFHRTPGVHYKMTNLRTTFAYCTHDQTEMGSKNPNPNVGEEPKALSLWVQRLPCNKPIEQTEMGLKNPNPNVGEELKELSLLVTEMGLKNPNPNVGDEPKVLSLLVEGLPSNKPIEHTEMGSENQNLNVREQPKELSILVERLPSIKPIEQAEMGSKNRNPNVGEEPKELSLLVEGLPSNKPIEQTEMGLENRNLNVREEPKELSLLVERLPGNKPIELTEMGLDNPDPNVGEEPKELSLRIVRLPSNKPVEFVFQKWMSEGFPVHKDDIAHTINRLRRRKWCRRAIEVMEWVIREKPYKLTELDYSYLLEFTMRKHGIAEGERLFLNVPTEFQNDLLYNNLVIGCLEKGLIRLPLEYMTKMRELKHPISHVVFDRLIILNSSWKRRKLIPKILAQMKADKVTPHASTFNILMKIEANDHNIDGVMKFFEDMKKKNIEPNKITYCILANAHAVARLLTVCGVYVEAIEKSKTGTNSSTYDTLINLYGYLGKPKDLDRIWRTVQELPQVRTQSFALAIQAFGRIRHLDRAEEIWEEMNSKVGKKSTDQYNCILSVYCKTGLVDKLSALVKEMKLNRCKPNALTYRHLALGCLKAGLMKEALKTLEMGSKQTLSNTVKKSSPWLETTLSIVELLALKGDVENAERLFDELNKGKYTRYTFVYNSLIKAYVHAKIYRPNLLKRMILAGARPDAETYSLVKLVEQFKPSL